MEINIRPAEDTDAAELLILMQKLIEESDTFTVEQDLAGITPEQQAGNIELLNSTTNNILLLAADDENQLYGLLSAAAVAGEPRTVEIGMAVLKEVQGFGIAQALLAELMDWAIDFSSVEKLFLTVQSHNQVAIHIYEKMGFVKLPNSERQLMNQNNVAVAAFDMVKRLVKG
ncbi:GNAT family N-acetyltransferase [Weissella muntiaci]|uniref:GNAT family N-acetyltransferase n=1 Tax=Weissella muntiaci TaxID=2508881 RepID=A0A6C2C1N4_9LACO|nr:GNAT family N-acetyltransferase [Weissella muntiaci]TYC47960.1 GNAT family N-acetyltransferase [Weissella muntiaci]